MGVLTLTALILSGCGQTVYLSTECPTIEPVSKIEHLKLETDANAQLTQESSYNAVTMIKQYRVKENYNDNEIKALRTKVDEIKNRGSKE